jgi:hypothetical protein
LKAVKELSLMWRTIYHEFRRWAKVSERAATAYKRTEITLETDRIWIVRNAHAKRGWCTECGREVDMVSLTEGEALSRPPTSEPRGTASLPPRTARPMLPGCGEQSGWHWSQASDGSPLICLESVLKSGGDDMPQEPN